MSLITVIGRGHSGTRAISHTLYASGVYMGNLLNRSGDKMPPQRMYDACRIMAKDVKWNGDLSWDFSDLQTCEIDPEWDRLIESYLEDTIKDKSEHKGWKIPETTLVYPWILRKFPEAKYIHWIRDPRDSVLSNHRTDDLGDFDIPYPKTDDLRKRRAISWYYQYQLMKATPRPENVITVRFEDFVLEQERTLVRLEKFLGIPLARIIVRKDPIGRWKTDSEKHDFDFFTDAMEEQGYND